MDSPLAHLREVDLAEEGLREGLEEPACPDYTNIYIIRHGRADQVDRAKGVEYGGETEGL